MNPLDALYEQAQKQKKKGIAVISNDYVLRMIREHRRIESEASSRLVEAQ
jgi:hypothetical protein